MKARALAVFATTVTLALPMVWQRMARFHSLLRLEKALGRVIQ